MGQRQNINTVRFTAEENKQIETYLKQNLIFDSFSSLARIATLGFIGQAQKFHLQPLADQKATQQKPSFLWDYDLNDYQIREILSRSTKDHTKLWLLAKILLEARFEEVFSYLTISDIQNALPTIRLPKKIRDRWEYAIQRWRQRDKN